MSDQMIGETSCCQEYAAATRLSRRTVLRALGATGLVTTFGSAAVTFGASAASAADTAPGDTTSDAILVVLSMRGAADGMSLMVPHGDPAYYAGRPTIAVPKGQLLVPDSFFGLHPSLAPLLPMWKSGQVAAIHATGMAVPNRSHFAAMELVEDADPGSSTRTGWLNRLIGTDTGPYAGSDALQGLAVGSDSPASLYGPQPTMSFSDVDSATVAGDSASDTQHSRRGSLDVLWSADQSPMGSAMRAMLGSVDTLAAARAETDDAGTYPDSDLGKALSSVARTLRADIGVGVVTVDQGSWDDHVGLSSVLPNRTTDLAKSIAAFFNDLGPVRDRVTLVTLSEFGRRVVENSARGLDHGWGNVMFAVGAGVKGGYYADWTPLQATLDADVPVTTDYRSVLAEIVTRRTGVSTATVFPGFSPERVGFMQA